MPIFKNDPFPGTDYSQYLKWDKVVLPSGQVLYVVPGNPGYVFDPIASNATGRKVFRANPQQAITDQQEEKDRADKLAKQQERNQSPIGQITPVLAGTGGVLAANEIMKAGFGKPPATVAAVDPKTGNVVMTDGTVQNSAGQVISSPAQSAAQGAVSASPTGSTFNPTSPEGTGTLGNATPDFTMDGTPQPDGSVVTNDLPAGSEVTADGSIIDAQTGATIGRVVQGVGGAYQIYAGLQEFKKDKVGGGLGIASGAANVGAALGSQTAGSLAGPITAAKGAYDTIKGFQHGGEGTRSGFTQLGAGIGTMVAPGLGTAAGAALGNVIGYGFQGDGVKNDVALGLVSPALLLGKKTGLLKPHKTTRQVAQEHTGQLLEQGKDNNNWQQYVAGMRQQFNAPPPDPSKPFAGKYATFEDYKKGGLEAADLTGVYGNLKVYGPEWASLTPEQRQAITQANIESGIYASKKGEVEITDEQKALENKNNVLKGFAVATQKPVMVNKAPAPITNATAAAQAAAQSGRR